jgi:parvulin-like peptidyl-prolyl isomerase
MNKRWFDSSLCPQKIGNLLREHIVKVRINAKKIFLISIIGLISFVMTACPGNPGGTANEVAATVNGKPILMKEVDNLLHQQMQGEETKLSNLELSQARLQILDGLIQKEVLFQRAEKENLIPSEDDITTEINKQIQNRGVTKEQYLAELQKIGQTEAGLREDTRKLLAIQKLQDKTTNKVQSPTDKIVEDFYNSNKEAFVRPRGIELAAIIVTPQETQGLVDDAKTPDEAQKKANNIAQQLKSGADFASVARARSEDQSSLNGGDIGFIAEQDLKGRFPEDLIKKFFSMNPGDITEPIALQGGYYIFKLVSKQEQLENLTLNSPGVKEKITTEITNQQKKVLVTAMQIAIMSDARIDNLLAKSLLEKPENLNVLRPAPQPGASPTASPTASPVASPVASPSSSKTPTAKETPKGK